MLHALIGIGGPWHLRRLLRMTPREAMRRVQDTAVKVGWRKAWNRGAALSMRGGCWPDRTAVTRIPDAVIFSVPATAKGHVQLVAEQVLSGCWPIFGEWRTDLAPAPDWFRDVHAGRRAPAAEFGPGIDLRKLARRCDVKHLWELSRHQHVTVLAAAYRFTGDTRYAERVGAQLRSWWSANPPLCGVNWSSGIELGIRLIAWTWIRRLLADWSETADLFEQNREFQHQLFAHQDYLARLPSHGSSANNHRIAEAAGQFVAGCAFPIFSQSQSWRDEATRTLQHEIPAQTFPCGLNRELATDYHGFVLELGLVAATEGERAGQSLGSEVWETLRRMTDAMAAVMDCCGRPPRQGDADDSRALLLDAPTFDRWASLLATGKVLFGACSWWPTVVHADARTGLWTSSVIVPALPHSRPAVRPALFEEAGIAILRDRAGGRDEIWCRCDHGPHGYLAIAAHAHADALSLEVRYGGRDILADPGTCCYDSDPRLRDYFRSTRAHNTIEVANSDQSLSGGTFLWTRHARAVLDHVEELDGGPVMRWSASHDGYSRLRPPAIHRRILSFERERRRLVVVDVLEGRGRHPLRLMFHLGPGVRCRQADSVTQLTWNDGPVAHRASLFLPQALHWRMVCGQTDPLLGWYSMRFGQREPAVVLVGSGSIDGGMRLETTLQFDVDGPGLNVEGASAEAST